MGRWSEAGVKCWLPKSRELEVGQITHFHNVDCAAYEKRIAELTAEVARVKAESLRVVPMHPKPRATYHWYMSPTGLGVLTYDPDENAQIESEHSHHRFADCKPVRLERWEEQG